MAIDSHNIIFSPRDKTNLLSFPKENVPYNFMVKSPKTYTIKMMEAMNKN